MAKQLVNPVERHIEKAVVGIAALVLIGVVVKYLATSPNQRELGRDSVTPKLIDSVVAVAADGLRKRIRDASPEEKPHKPRFDEFVALLDPFDEAGVLSSLPRVTSLHPEVPVIDPKEIIGPKQLVTVVTVGKPAVTYGRAIFSDIGHDEKSSGYEYEPVNWATVSGVFDVEDQRARQAREYGPLRRKVIFGPAEIQRRTRRTDGTWSDDDWEAVDVYPVPDLPAEPDIPLVDDDGKIIVRKADYLFVDRFKSDLAEASRQLNLLRPMLPPVLAGDCITFPVITTTRDVFLQDDEYLYPTEPPAADPDIRYPCLRFETADGKEDTDLDCTEQIKKDFEEAERLLKQAWQLKNENDAILANNIAVSIIQDSCAAASDKTRAEKLRARAGQIEKDIRRWHRGPGSREESPRDTGDSPQRTLRKTQQFWAHDARPGSLEGGKTYQYRIRPWIYNRLAGLPRDLEDKNDATVIYIPGAWSVPSDPIAVEAAHQFFVTSFKAQDEKITVELYQWFEGVWVSTRQAFGIGDRLVAKDVRTDVPDPDDPEGKDNALVPFEADAIVGDIDPDRRCRVPKRSSRGIKFNDPERVCSVVLINPDGSLQERVVKMDKRHPAKKALAERVWRAPRIKASRAASSRGSRKKQSGFGPAIGQPSKGR